MGRTLRIVLLTAALTFGVATPANADACVYGAIGARYAQLGGTAGFGNPLVCESGTPDGRGRFNHFDRGNSIYWTPQTGAQEVHGAIRQRWEAMGWERGLGYPLTGEFPSPGGLGRMNHFERGTIMWTRPSSAVDSATASATPIGGAFAIYGAIRSRWQAQGSDTGAIGFPATDELGTPDGVGRFNHFNRVGAQYRLERNSIYWTPSTGAQIVKGAIRDEWARLGWEKRRLGYPVGEEYAIPDSSYPTDPDSLPTLNVNFKPGGVRQNFQGGYITHRRTSPHVFGRVEVFYAVPLPSNQSIAWLRVDGPVKIEPGYYGSIDLAVATVVNTKPGTCAMNSIVNLHFYEGDRYIGNSGSSLSTRPGERVRIEGFLSPDLREHYALNKPGNYRVELSVLHLGDVWPGQVNDGSGTPRPANCTGEYP